MNRRNIIGAIAMSMCMCMLGGCGSSVYKPDQSGILVNKDGSVKGAEVESFDNSAFSEERYQESELVSFVEDTVSAYNKDCGCQEAAYLENAENLKVSIETLEVEDAVATLILDYSSIEDYLDFNDGGEEVLSLALQTAPEAIAAGESLDHLKDAEGNDVDTTAEETNDKCYVVKISGDTIVTVEGKIIAVADGVEILDKKSAKVCSEKNLLILFK